MPLNYQNGKIYKIECNITNEIYIGSTCEPTLARRLTGHVAQYKRYKNCKGNNVTSFKIIERGDYNIYLIENFPCTNRDELTKREGETIKNMHNDNIIVNKIIAGRAKAEWRVDNSDKIKKQNYEYRTNNKEKIKEQNKKYCADNKDKIKEKNKKYNAQKAVKYT